MTLARPRSVVVVGAGIGGLSTAHALLSASTPDLPIGVTLLEASGRGGGKLHTIELDGMPVEAGADSFVVRKPWAVDRSARMSRGESSEASGSFIFCPYSGSPIVVSRPDSSLTRMRRSLPMAAGSMCS